MAKKRKRATTGLSDDEECWLKATLNGRIDDIKRLLKQGIKVNITTDLSGLKALAALHCAAAGDGM